MSNKEERVYTATSDDEMEAVFTSIRREFKDKNGKIDISVSLSGCDEVTKPTKGSEDSPVFVIFMHEYPQINALKTKAYALNDDADSAAGSYFLNLNGQCLNEGTFQSLDDEYLNKLSLVEDVTLYAGANVSIITLVHDLHGL